MVKHTPGPWFIENDGDSLNVIGHPTWECSRFGKAGEWDVATITEFHEDNKDETISNARLISAAPDLLECLVELYAIVRGECPQILNEDSGGSAELELSIIEAISKARGETNDHN